MMINFRHPLPKLRHLPKTLPREGTLCIELQDGVPIMRASSRVQERIERLLSKQKEYHLTMKEAEEIERYEEVDDYVGFINRMIRNLYIKQQQNA